MRKPCTTCKHDHGRCAGKSRKGGHQYCWEPKTNGDRIRAMNDEELAELFDSIVDNGMSCHLICGDLDKCKRNNSIERICKNHYLKWLKQPLKEEE